MCWEGPGSGFESSSGGGAGASAGGVWKSRNLPPWDRGRKTRFSNGLAHNRSKVSGSWAEIDGVHINFSRSIFPFMSENHENGCLTRFGFGKLLDFPNPFVAGI